MVVPSQYVWKAEKAGSVRLVTLRSRNTNLLQQHIAEYMNFKVAFVGGRECKRGHRAYLLPFPTWNFMVCTPTAL